VPKEHPEPLKTSVSFDEALRLAMMVKPEPKAKKQPAKKKKQPAKK
jgi:hypothetical protein